MHRLVVHLRLQMGTLLFKGRTSLCNPLLSVKQAITKLLLTFSFRKIFLIGQNLKSVQVTYSLDDFFDLLLINCSGYFLFEV